MLPKFFVLEGGEGSGKSSISKWIVSRLNGSGVDALSTREPGGSPYAEKIRKVIFADEAKHADAETMFGLVWAARRDHLINKIIPAAEKGTVVICDRFDASTYAYQIAGQEQPGLKDLFWRIRAHYLGLSTPQAYVIFDVDPSIGLARVKNRANTRTHFDNRDIGFHQRVRAGFFEFSSSAAQIESHTVDASLPMDKVQRTVLDLLERLINRCPLLSPDAR
jgi:dTMP kinase